LTILDAKITFTFLATAFSKWAMLYSVFWTTSSLLISTCFLVVEEVLIVVVVVVVVVFLVVVVVDLLDVVVVLIVVELVAEVEGVEIFNAFSFFISHT